MLEQNEKAPNGIEIRMKKVKILSQPEDEMMPLAISKWKLNTSLEAKLNIVPFLLEISGSVQNSGFRKD